MDGNDPEAVYGVAARTIARARAGEGPSLVEATTYRHGGHSRADPGKYRPEGELDRWRERDPLTVAATLLREQLGVDAADLARIESEVDAELDRVQAEALGAPFPSSVTIPEFNDG